MKNLKLLIMLLSILVNVFLGYQYSQYSRTMNEVEDTITYAANMTLANIQGIVDLTNKANVDWQSAPFNNMLYNEIVQIQRNGASIQSLAHVKSETLSEIRYNLALLTGKLDVEIIPIARKMAGKEQSLSKKELDTLKSFFENVRDLGFTNQIQSDGGLQFNEKLSRLLNKL